MYFKFKEQLKLVAFNPHIHLILLVRKDYWNQKSKQWAHKRLGQKWKEALELDYTPVVWVSLIRNGEFISDKQENVFNDIDPKKAKAEK